MMKVDKKSIEEILDGSIHLAVPLYQRAYVWNEEKSRQQECSASLHRFYRS